jgi:hypothetical protein
VPTIAIIAVLPPAAKILRLDIMVSLPHSDALYR